MIQETLQEMGLGRRESLCYTALLELGSSKVGSIVQKTGIPSSKIYEVLDKLISKGLVAYVKIGKIKHYQASDPKTLLSYLDEKKRNVQEIIPQLLLKQKFAKKQNVEMFEGQKAIFSLFTNLIEDARPGEEYIVFSIDEEGKDEAANLFFKNLAVRRKDRRLDVKVLKNMRFYKKEHHTKLKLRYSNLNLPQGMTIFRNTFVILTWANPPLAIKV